MTLQIGLDGHDPRDVVLARDRGHATVWLDGVPYPATIAPEGAATVLEIEGRREIVWCLTERDTVFVHAFGRSWTLRVSDPAESSLRSERGADAAIAPMPGVLVSLAVAAGEQVVKGQVLAVIESMKMHSEILAPRDGEVETVLVALGENFDQGTPLITLAPETPGAEPEGT